MCFSFEPDLQTRDGSQRVITAKFTSCRAREYDIRNLSDPYLAPPYSPREPSLNPKVVAVTGQSSSSPYCGAARDSPGWQLHVHVAVAWIFATACGQPCVIDNKNPGRGGPHCVAPN